MDDKRVEQLEDLFKRIFSNTGRMQNYWPKTYKQRYFRKLRHDFGLSSSTTSEKSLPLKIIDNKRVASILEAVQKYDTELRTFESFYINYEKYGRKEVSSIDIKDFINKIDEVKLQSQENEYSLCNNEDWEIIYSNEKDDKISISLGKSSYKKVNAELTKGDFETNNEWTAIIEATKSKTKESIEDLLKVRISAVIPKRTMFSLSLDKKDGILEICHDNFEVDSEGKRIRPEKKVGEVDKAITQALDHLSIQNQNKTELKHLLKAPEKNLFSSIEVEDLQTYSSPDMIIVFSQQEYYFSDDDYDQLSEELRSKLTKMQINDIVKKSREFYNENGKLTGFFTKYPELDINNAHIGGKLNRDDDVDQRSFHAYAVLVRDEGEYDDSRNHYEGYFKGKVIEHISFEYDFDNGCLDIKNSNYSELMHETLISRIREIYKGKH